MRGDGNSHSEPSAARGRRPPAAQRAQPRRDRAGALQLTSQGELEPTAQQVAARARVGIRSVFRHFADMDSLYAELGAQVRAEVVPLMQAGFRGTPSERARELVARRARVFEVIGPHKRAANLARRRSLFLQRQHVAMVRELRAALLRALPGGRRRSRRARRCARPRALVRVLGSAAQRPAALARARGRGRRAHRAHPRLRDPAHAQREDAMTETATLTVIGAPGSPYSRKLRAVLRYRRIPHVWVHRMSPESRALPQPRVQLLPTVVTATGPGGALEARTDSTPLIRAFERERAGRAAIPPDPVVAFLDAILEDYGDEWLTKAMFHYRWVYAGRHREGGGAAAALGPDRRAGGRGARDGRDDREAPDRPALGRGLQRDHRAGDRGQLPAAARAARCAPRALALRHGRAAGRERLRAVRSAHPARALRSHARRARARGRAASGRVGRRRRGSVRARAHRCGLVVARRDPADASPRCSPRPAASTRRSCSRTPPRSQSGAERVECEIDGRPWVQQPFPYQGKCLAWLREAHAALAPADRRAADAALAGTGLERLFAA